MLFYTVNKDGQDVKVYVSEAETENVKRRLAGKASYDVLGERERRIAIEMARRVSISAMANKLAAGAKKVWETQTKELNSMKITPEEHQAQSHALQAEYNAELARIAESKL